MPPLVRYGHHTVGAMFQHCGERGQHLCPVTVSVHDVSTRDPSPLQWRPFLPQSWAEDRDCCVRAGVPGTVGHRTKQTLILDLVDEFVARHLVPPLPRFPWQSETTSGVISGVEPTDDWALLDGSGVQDR